MIFTVFPAATVVLSALPPLTVTVSAFLTSMSTKSFCPSVGAGVTSNFLASDMIIYPSGSLSSTYFLETVLFPFV